MESCPWIDLPPAMQVYEDRGARLLSKRLWETKCFKCIWVNMANVEIQWDFDKNINKYRFKTFCYGPKSCKIYRMGRKPKVKYQLTNLANQVEPSEVDINNILRAADEIIGVAGRTMLAKILKGSKDKKILENQLDLCPSYGYYNHLTLEEITKRIDWMIVNYYLEIQYNGRLPMIVFSEIGWETYKPVYVDELYDKILNVESYKKDLLIQQLTQTNRQVVNMLLSKIAESRNIGFIRFLTAWEVVEVKKVRNKINWVIMKLKSV